MIMYNYANVDVRNRKSFLPKYEDKLIHAHAHTHTHTYTLILPKTYAGIHTKTHT